ncbi:YlbL family protein [Actinoalloteichus spitiensis]|uniref:YlbL family protein n=1 Tax=Actinoalloteichus spitiensis TaxID=252394 RepID=UPI00068B590A|nr:S16 family serine protease [Actinoalloteichus spitiensis]
MSRRTWSLLVSVALVGVFAAFGGFVTVPYVALGPGHTYDTLGLVATSGEVAPPPLLEEGDALPGETGADPDPGELRLTTVQLTTDVTLFGALGLWASGNYALAPREEYYPPDRTREEIEQENRQSFTASQSSAETAALLYLGYPRKVLVGEVFGDGPSDGVLEPGDELVVVNGVEADSAEAVVESLADTSPGDRVDIVIRREGVEEDLTVELGARDDRESGYLGVAPLDQPDVDFEVDIELDEVGGPSAGLMFALAIIDTLSPGEITGGTHVAGTGEITTQGAVRPIGGISFKMRAAKDIGSTVFLVPTGNCAEAVANAPDGLQLVEVETLEGAVDALRQVRAGEQPPDCSPN